MLGMVFIAAAGEFINFIQKYHTGRCFQFILCMIQQVVNDVAGIPSAVSCFAQRCRIKAQKRQFSKPGCFADKRGLTAAGRSIEQQTGIGRRIQTFGAKLLLPQSDRYRALGACLTDDEAVKFGDHLLRTHDACKLQFRQLFFADQTLQPI